MFKPDFLITPFKLVDDKSLTPKDREVYAVVYWFQHLKDGRCTAGNETIGEILETDGRVVRRSLEMLEQRGYIERIYFDEAKKKRAEIRALVSYRVGQGSPTLFDGGRTGESVRVGQGGPQISKDISNKDNASATAAARGPFSLKEEIAKLEDSKRRDMNVIALYLEEKKPDIKTYEQLSVAIKRHLRAAHQLKVFSDDQIIRAIPRAKAITPDWTIETVVKVLTK